MREILFKAKQVGDDEWVEGYYLRDQYHIGGKDIIFYRKDSDRFTVYTDRIDLGYWIDMVYAMPVGNIFDNPELLQEEHK